MSRFQKDNKFGTGRILGSRNQTTLWLETLGHDRIEKVVGKVGDKAEEGDMRAASLVLARAWPARRGNPVELELPPVDQVDGIVKAQAEVVACLGRGELTPDEASSISRVLENQRKAIETSDIARRIEELERRKKKERRPGGGKSLAELILDTPRVRDDDAGSAG